MAVNPKKKPGLAVGIMVGVPKKGANDDLGSPDPVDKAPQENEPDGDEENEAGEGECTPNPAAVGFRSELETCQHCHYMQGDMCSHPIVAQQVQPGDSCAAFEDKQEGSMPNQGQAPLGEDQVEEQS